MADSFPSHLLGELARCYMRAALNKFMREMEAEIESAAKADGLTRRGESSDERSYYTIGES